MRTPQRPTANAKAMMGQKRPKTAMQAQKQAVAKNKQTQARSTGRTLTSKSKTGGKSFLADMKAMQAQEQARSTNTVKEPAKVKPTTAAQRAKLNSGRKFNATQANAMRNAGNTQKPRVPKQAVQIKPSASKRKGPTNAPLKSRRASAQNRMAQRKASMMARRSK